MPMGADPCIEVMYDRQFTKDYVYLINRLDPILLYDIMTAKYYRLPHGRWDWPSYDQLELD